MPAPPRTQPRRPPAPDSSRLLPLLLAGSVCFVTAFILGYGSWYLFGSRRRDASAERPVVVQTTATPKPTEERPSPTPPRKLAPAGELPVPGGEIALGGEGTDQPLHREFVAPFAIAETEATNEQYRDFIAATKHKPPDGWNGAEFQPGTGAEPVTGINWQDAMDYCKWLSEQLGTTVRLPTEAEWERAARGQENLKYPWGQEWNPRAAITKETRGSIRPVKSFAENRSPYGAYDMAGNVWEWTADEARDDEGHPKMKDSIPLRIIKGGSFDEPQAFINATARYEMPANHVSRKLGFRYVVLRDSETKAAQGH
jgi:formylglycine-generating enzyme required for sulfatase activity